MSDRRRCAVLGPRSAWALRRLDHRSWQWTGERNRILALGPWRRACGWLDIVDAPCLGLPEVMTHDHRADPKVAAVRQVDPEALIAPVTAAPVGMVEFTPGRASPTSFSMASPTNFTLW